MWKGNIFYTTRLTSTSRWGCRATKREVQEKNRTLEKKIKGRWKRWSPQQGCYYLGPYLAHHLQNKHRMKPTSSVYKTSLKIAVKYKGLREEIEDMSKLASACWKRSQADESDDDVFPPSPPKRKAAKNSQSVSVPAAANNLPAPSVTSTAVPSKTTSEPSKSSNNPVPGPLRSLTLRAINQRSLWARPFRWRWRLLCNGGWLLWREGTQDQLPQVDLFLLSLFVHPFCGFP